MAPSNNQPRDGDDGNDGSGGGGGACAASLYVVGPDNDGGDGSRWGVQVVMWVNNDVVAFIGSSTLLLTYLVCK